MTGAWEHKRNIEITSRRRVFSTFLEYSQMRGVFYHSVIHGLSFFTCFVIKILCAPSRNNKAHRSINWRNLIPLKSYIPRLPSFLLLRRELHHKMSSKKTFFAILTKMLTRRNEAKNNKTRFFYALYCDQSPMYIIKQSLLFIGYCFANWVALSIL